MVIHFDQPWWCLIYLCVACFTLFLCSFVVASGVQPCAGEMQKGREIVRGIVTAAMMMNDAHSHKNSKSGKEKGSFHPGSDN